MITTTAQCLGGRARIGLLIITALAVVWGVYVRCAYVNAQSLWHDEVYSFAMLHGVDAYLFPGADLAPAEVPRPAGEYQARLRQDRWLQSFGRNIIHEGHPPVYYVTAFAWSRLLGGDPVSLRTLSALAGVLAVVGVAIAAYLLSGVEVALLVTCVACTSPFLVHYAHEARSYSLGLAWLSCALAAASAIRQRSQISCALATAFVGSATLALYTHYYLSFAVVLLGASVATSSTLNRPIWRLVTGASPLILFVPWLPVLAQQTRVYAGTHWTEGQIQLQDLVVALPRLIGFMLLGPYGPATLVEAIGTGALCGCALLGLLMSRDRVGMAALAAIGLQFAGIGLVDLVTGHRTLLVPRYGFGVFLPLLLALVIGLRGLGRAGVVVAVLFSCWAAWLSRDTATGDRAPRQALREAAAYLDNHRTAGDIVLAIPSGPTLLGLAYYGSPHAIIGGVPPEGVDAALSAARAQHHGVWLAFQRLGLEPAVPYRAAEGVSVQTKRFVGLDLVYVAP